MVDTSLLEPQEQYESLLFDEEGNVLITPKDLWFSKIGPHVVPYLEQETGPEKIEKHLFYKALRCFISQSSDDFKRTLSDAQLEEYFSDMKRIPNIKSSHLLRLKCGDIGNLAKKVDLQDKGIDTRCEDRSWISAYKIYASHNITLRLGANYIFLKDRQKENVIKDFFDENLPDQETSFYFHFAIACALLGRTHIKALYLMLGLKNVGKSLVFIVLAKMFGTYFGEISTEELLSRTTKDLLITLRLKMNQRLLVAHELPKKAKVVESFFKQVTGRNPFQSPYRTDVLDDFIPECTIFIDSNHPLVPEDGFESDLMDRMFIFKYGKRPIKEEDQDIFLSNKLTTQENLDTYFSWLLDTYIHDVFYGRKPKKSRFMVEITSYYVAKDQPIVFFIQKCCILMGTHVASDLQPKTVTETFTFFFFMMQNFIVRMMEKLGLNYDDDGNILSSAKLRMRIRLPTLKEFKDSFDRIVKTPTPDVDRTAKGLGYRTVYIKEPLLCWSLCPEVEEIFGGFESFLDMLDTIQQVEDSVLAIRSIPTMYTDMVRHAKKRITETTAILLGDGQTTKHQTSYPGVEDIMALMMMQNLLPDGKKDAVVG